VNKQLNVDSCLVAERHPALGPIGGRVNASSRLQVNGHECDRSHFASLNVMDHVLYLDHVTVPRSSTNGALMPLQCQPI